jgi:hypothetical protein
MGKTPFSIGIVTTAHRETILHTTLKSLGRGHRIHIFRDRAPGLYRNHRAAWDTLFTKGTRALLLQDDVIASRGWYETVSLFAERFPTCPVISFFWPWHQGASDKGRGYVYSNQFWEQAILMTKWFNDFFNAHISQKILDDNKMGRRPGDYHHDCVLWDVMELTGRKGMIVCPPVFQHTNVASSVGNPLRSKGKERSSKLFWGEDRDVYAYFKKKLVAPQWVDGRVLQP